MIPGAEIHTPHICLYCTYQYKGESDIYIDNRFDGTDAEARQRGWICIPTRIYGPDTWVCKEHAIQAIAFEAANLTNHHDLSSYVFQLMKIVMDGSGINDNTYVHVLPDGTCSIVVKELAIVTEMLNLEQYRYFGFRVNAFYYKKRDKLYWSKAK